MLDVLAHEVRQPLNNASAALQGASVALHELGGDEARQRLVRAQNVVGQVLARIDNTLAVAALLARPGPVEREEADIDTVVAVAVADMPAGERPRIRVQRETSTRSLPMDMGLMRLALRNLLSNALKYSPLGAQVVVRLSDSESPLGLLIDVVDRGPGVEPALRERLFERGARGKTPGSSHGLGLYIVRRVMELHGGRAELLETGPEGTTMRLLVVDAQDD
jgi:signal transduction histidine kinase